MADELYRTLIFSFRRDLWPAENLELLGTLERSAHMLLLFVLNPKNADPTLSIIRNRGSATKRSATKCCRNTVA